MLNGWTRLPFSQWLLFQDNTPLGAIVKAEAGTPCYDVGGVPGNHPLKMPYSGWVVSADYNGLHTYFSVSGDDPAFAMHAVEQSLYAFGYRPKADCPSNSDFTENTYWGPLATPQKSLGESLELQNCSPSTKDSKS
jgi:hypothetical protein